MIRPFEPAKVTSKRYGSKWPFFYLSTDTLHDEPFVDGEKVEVLWPDRHQSLEKVMVDVSPAGHKQAFIMINGCHGIEFPLRVIDHRIKLRRLNG